MGVEKSVPMDIFGQSKPRLFFRALFRSIVRRSIPMMLLLYWVIEYPYHLTD